MPSLDSLIEYWEGALDSEIELEWAKRFPAWQGNPPDKRQMIIDDILGCFE